MNKALNDKEFHSFTNYLIPKCIYFADCIRGEVVQQNGLQKSEYWIFVTFIYLSFELQIVNELLSIRHETKNKCVKYIHKPPVKGDISLQEIPFQWIIYA